MALDGRLLSNVSVLAAVVEGGNFARAADALGLTPSGVSRAIARLEARIGVRLLDRTTRSVNLTDEGRLLYAHINPLVLGIEDAVNSAIWSPKASISRFVSASRRRHRWSRASCSTPASSPWRRPNTWNGTGGLRNRRTSRIMCASRCEAHLRGSPSHGSFNAAEK